MIEELASLPPDERDAAFDAWLGTAPSDAPGPDMIGYHASGVAPIARAIVETAPSEDDVVFDLGVGLGKVLLLTKYLTRAKTRGIEIQPSLVKRARDRDLDVVEGDMCEADLREGTIFFLYNPLSGARIARLLERLHDVSKHHAITVCALGIDLRAPWLVPRQMESFWLTIYDAGTRPSQNAWVHPLARELAREARCDP